MLDFIEILLIMRQESVCSSFWCHMHSFWHLHLFQTCIHLPSLKLEDDHLSLDWDGWQDEDLPLGSSSLHGTAHPLEESAAPLLPNSSAALPGNVIILPDAAWEDALLLVGDVIAPSDAFSPDDLFSPDAGAQTPYHPPPFQNWIQTCLSW
jgi:hypothetical protein